STLFARAEENPNNELKIAATTQANAHLEMLILGPENSDRSEASFLVLHLKLIRSVTKIVSFFVPASQELQISLT
ncbi:MAG: hypothetical protein HKN35_05135, partial [Woeseia sp.]|nr:hypothetical protein [Woeseia sp.]